MKERIIATDPNRTFLLIRIMVGFYFLAGGFLKFVYPELQPTGYFQDFGQSAAGTIVILISSVEVLCGFMILIGLFTRIAVIPLLISILVMIFAGKLSIFFEEGLWMMAHLSRVDFAMFMGGIFLLINGSGYWSADWSMQSKNS